MLENLVTVTLVRELAASSAAWMPDEMKLLWPGWFRPPPPSGPVGYPPEPAGVAKEPSARRKLLAPPPDRGTIPAAAAPNVLIESVSGEVERSADAPALI